MKKRFSLYVLAIAACSLFTTASAENSVMLLNEQVNIKKSSVVQKDEKITVSMVLDFSKLKIKSNQVYTLTPVIRSGGNEKKLPKIQIVGRKKEIYLQRNPSEFSDQKIYRRLLRKNKTKQAMRYAVKVPHEAWMENSSLMLIAENCGCALEIKEESENKLQFVNLTPVPFVPVLAYIRPQVEEVKRRNVSESAYLEFKVNRSNIEPDFRGNQAELSKITRFISEAKADKNISIQNIQIHGFASPDGSYKLNERLSRERSISMANYLKQMYGMSDKDISVTSTPEDWVGLRKRVAESPLDDREAILAVIDGVYAEDAKEFIFKNNHPEAYQYMATNIFPLLRRSDCELDFIARNFNLEETKKIIKTNPVQLSMNEMYLVAETYPVGSDEFNEVFEIAARMFPNDAIANLNVANSALSRNDLAQAKKFLQKAPRGPEKDNANGVVAMLENNFDLALNLFEKAKKAGIKVADKNIQQIKQRLGLVEMNTNTENKENTTPSAREI